MMPAHKNYTVQIVHEAEGNIDVAVEKDGRVLRMLSTGGPEREMATLSPFGNASVHDLAEKLPVLVGSGLGHALSGLLDRVSGPVAVVDKEEAVLAATGLRQRFTDPRIKWICEPVYEAALTALSRWQEEHGGRPFLPLVNSFYLRLDRPWYVRIRDDLEASARYDFWGKAVRPRFQEAVPRLLLITSKYFLLGEVAGACQRLGIPVQLLELEDQELGGVDFIRRLLTCVLTFRPDCVLTLNHLGIDREGLLTDMLARLKLPLASWFVDNPHLILHLYAGLTSPWTTLFTWDADNLDSLRALGFEHVHYLPLGTDPQRFRPRPKEKPGMPLLPTRVSFVGNSMVTKVAQRMKKTHLPAALLRGYRETAAAFGASEERSAGVFIQQGALHVAQAYATLEDDETRLAFETLLTWEATRQYRARCVRQTLPFNPLIVGDTGWKTIFRNEKRPWNLHPEVSYYDGLPLIYPFSDINFNCTSKQMKGAVNQRVFDVPAAGGFVLTDWREQMESLFEPGREMIFYREPEEAGELIRHYLDHPQERQNIAQAGRARVLDEHTWAHRVQSLLATMKDIYGTPKKTPGKPC